MHQGEADPAQPGVPRLDRGKRQRGADRGIDRIAPCIRIATPARAASRDCDTTMPRRPVAPGLMTDQFWVTGLGG